MADFAAYSYEAVASFYDELAAFYSLGRIEESKLSLIDLLSPGERVLFAGVGRGGDALAAARRGAKVTAIDLSPRMLARLARALEKEGLQVELIEGDVAGHHADKAYDTVVASYFLNLFDRVEAAEMLDTLCRLTHPAGRLMFADFAPGEGGLLGRWLTEAYYRPVNWIAWALGFCARHPILDYEELIAGAGARLVSVKRFPIVRGGTNPAYQSVLAERTGSRPAMEMGPF